MTDVDEDDLPLSVLGRRLQQEEEEENEPLSKRARRLADLASPQQFVSLPRSVQLELLIASTPPETARWCGVNRRFAFTVCGIGYVRTDRTPMGQIMHYLLLEDNTSIPIADNDVIYEHWRDWLLQDYGISHTARLCRALSPFERQIVADSMERFVPLVVPGSSTNLERLLRLRHLYRRLFEMADSGKGGGVQGVHMRGTQFLYYRDGIVISQAVDHVTYNDNDDESDDDDVLYHSSGPAYLFCVVDMMHQTSPVQMRVPLTLPLIKRDRNVHFNLHVSHAHTGVYLFGQSSYQENYRSAQLVCMGDRRIVVAEIPLPAPHEYFPDQMSIHIDPNNPYLAYVQIPARDTIEVYEVDYSNEDSLPPIENWQYRNRWTHLPPVRAQARPLPIAFRLTNQNTVLVTRRLQLEYGRDSDLGFNRVKIVELTKRNAAWCFGKTELNQSLDANIFGPSQIFIVPVLARDRPSDQRQRFETRCVFVRAVTPVQSMPWINTQISVTSDEVSVVDMPRDTNARDPIAFHYAHVHLPTTRVGREYRAILGDNILANVASFKLLRPQFENFSLLTTLNLETGDTHILGGQSARALIWGGIQSSLPDSNTSTLYSPPLRVELTTTPSTVREYVRPQYRHRESAQIDLGFPCSEENLQRERPASPGIYYDDDSDGPRESDPEMFDA